MSHVLNKDFTAAVFHTFHTLSVARSLLAPMTPADLPSESYSVVNELYGAVDQLRLVDIDLCERSARGKLSKDVANLSNAFVETHRSAVTLDHTQGAGELVAVNFTQAKALLHITKQLIKSTDKMGRTSRIALTAGVILAAAGGIAGAIYYKKHLDEQTPGETSAS